MLGWIQKYYQIRKDRLDIKLKKKELEEKERKEKEDLIRPATFEEVKEFDPKIIQIVRKLQEEEPGDKHGDYAYFALQRFPFLFVMITTIIVIFLFFWICSN